MHDAKRFDLLQTIVLDDLNLFRLEIGDRLAVLRKIRVDRHEIRAGAETGQRLLRRRRQGQ